ncbi:MAG: glycosyltransferase [Planctomycetota bacterium]|nr:glycosyltransferase [Planctomycetota bacterium]
MTSIAHRPKVSLVVPCYNEEPAIPHLRRELTALADALVNQHGCECEILLVDDGSRDRTWEHIRAFTADDARVRGARLSRNFGHQAALTCGYDLASGDVIICLDADLQDPPNVVPEMIAKWRAGADVVYAIRKARQGETAFKLFTASLFYKLIRKLSAADIRENSGDFRLMSRRSLDALNRLRERQRFIRGMVGWVGYRTDEVHYERLERVAGVTKYPFRKMLLLAADAIVSFSRFPLKLAYWCAFSLSGLFLAYLLVSLVRYFAFNTQMVPGWPSLIATIIAFGAANLLCVGLLGEYVGRIYEEIKQRPIYLLQEVVSRPGDAPPGNPGSPGIPGNSGEPRP